MPVPKRRQGKGVRALINAPSMALKLLDIDFVFTNTKTLLLYGFAPAVVVLGMWTEPAPASWFDLVNIWQCENAYITGEYKDNWRLLRGRFCSQTTYSQLSGTKAKRAPQLGDKLIWQWSSRLDYYKAKIATIRPLITMSLRLESSVPTWSDLRSSQFNFLQVFCVQH